MEVKINKEIQNYQESIFFGLSLRQFSCSLVALGAAVGIYFGLKPIVGEETVSWLCIVCAAPIAVTGFFKYNGLSFEEFVWAWLKSEFLMSGKRVYISENIYDELLKEVKRHDGTKTKKLLEKFSGKFFNSKKRTEVNSDKTDI